MILSFDFEPPPPWSTNQDRNLHHMERAETISLWKQLTSAAYVSRCNKLNIGQSRPPAFVQIVIPFKKGGRRDPHNYCGTVVKAILDGLVASGAWPDDTPEHVEHLPPILRVNKAGRVEVTILPRRQLRLPCEHGEYQEHVHGRATMCREFIALEDL